MKLSCHQIFVLCLLSCIFFFLNLVSYFLPSLSLLFLGLKQDEWTGEQKLQYGDIPEDIEREEIRPLGNYAVSITWPDGFNQVTYSMFLLQWMSMIFVTILQTIWGYYY